MANRDAGMVVMVHDGIDSEAKVTQEQFDRLWSNKGWTIKETLGEDPQASQEDAGQPVTGATETTAEAPGAPAGASAEAATADAPVTASKAGKAPKP